MTTSSTSLDCLEQFVRLSVELHNLNLFCQKQIGLSLVQWVVLRKTIQLPATSAKTLADATGVHASSLTPTLTRLEELNYIFIFERSMDQRRKLIVVSRLGWECVKKFEDRFTGESKKILNLNLRTKLSETIEMVGAITSDLDTPLRAEH